MLFIIFISYVKLTQLVGRLTLVGIKRELCLNYCSVVSKCWLSTSCFTPLRLKLFVYRSTRTRELDNHTSRYDMAQSSGYSKNPLNINPFQEKASVEPPLEWSKWAAILEMAVFAKEGIEVQTLLRARRSLVEPSEPVYEVERTGETEAEKKKRDVRNQEKLVGWENHVIKAREKGVLCNSFRWDESDAKVSSYLFLCLRAEGQRQIQQKRPSLELYTVTTKELMTR